ncbi:hypothetical protein ANCCAN_19585, partial [Ancylostoma caninum]
FGSTLRSIQASVRVVLYHTFTLFSSNHTCGAFTLYFLFRVHSHRRKCDDLFPDGNEVDTDLTVDEVDRIEEHVSRYMASQLLRKCEFADAERLLIYANSIDSKKLLIKVYQSWLQKGILEERDRSHLLKRVRDLQIECQEYDLRERSPSTNSAASVASAGDNVASAITPSARKILVDACTNTPNRGDTVGSLICCYPESLS